MGVTTNTSPPSLSLPLPGFSACCKVWWCTSVPPLPPSIFFFIDCVTPVLEVYRLSIDWNVDEGVWVCVWVWKWGERWGVQVWLCVSATWFTASTLVSCCSFYGIKKHLYTHSGSTTNVILSSYVFFVCTCCYFISSSAAHMIRERLLTPAGCTRSCMSLTTHQLIFPLSLLSYFWIKATCFKSFLHRLKIPQQQILCVWVPGRRRRGSWVVSSVGNFAKVSSSGIWFNFIWFYWLFHWRLCVVLYQLIHTLHQETVNQRKEEISELWSSEYLMRGILMSWFSLEDLMHFLKEPASNVHVLLFLMCLGFKHLVPGLVLYSLTPFCRSEVMFTPGVTVGPCDSENLLNALLHRLYYKYFNVFRV